jgi:hypothetical protein
MEWNEPTAPKKESEDDRLKKELNAQIKQLMKKGTPLIRIVEFLGAEEFLTYTKPRKGQSPVAHFEVDEYIKKRSVEKNLVRLPEQFITIDEVFVPAQEGHIITGSGNGFEGLVIEPRSELLKEIMTEMGLRYFEAEGQNNSRMFRKLSYKVFILPDNGKMIFFSDEKGNSTFIIHSAQLEELKKFTKMKKEELNSLPESLVSVVSYPRKEDGTEEKKWKEQIKDLILNGPGEHVSSNEIGEAPDGWATPTEIAKTAGFDIETVENIAAGRIGQSAELTKRFLNRNRQRTLFYCPELKKFIEEELSKRERAPEGWMTKRGLASLLDVDFASVERIVDGYAEMHPDWFKEYRSIKGNMRIFLGPELVEIVRKVVEKRKSVPLAPGGWQTRRKVADTNGLTFKSVDKEAEKLRGSHPEWFGEYLTSNDRVKEFFHPDLIKLIIKKQKELELAPPGWMTAGALGKTIEVSTAAVQSRAEKFRSQHPEWFKKYRHPKGQRLEFYCPELVKILTDGAKK